MPTCCVFGCNNRTQDTTYYRFPSRPPTLVEQWNRVTGASTPDESRRYFVCSRHFVESDFEYYRQGNLNDRCIIYLVCKPKLALLFNYRSTQSRLSWIPHTTPHITPITNIAE